MRAISLHSLYITCSVLSLLGRIYFIYVELFRSRLFSRWGLSGVGGRRVMRGIWEAGGVDYVYSIVFVLPQVVV